MCTAGSVYITANKYTKLYIIIFLFVAITLCKCSTGVKPNEAPPMAVVGSLSIVIPYGGQILWSWFWLTLQSPVVAICTTRFNMLKPYILPTQCICVFRTVLTINIGCFPE
jgi:hypothetical protein